MAMITKNLFLQLRQKETKLMTASVIGIVPVIILIALFQKYIVQGLTEGAVKG